MLCACKNALELENEPNIHVCPICMGFPGMLPRINEEVIRLGVIAGMMMHSEINTVSRFDRKSYFYPDLPNSFQTTQMHEPIVKKWYIDVLVWNELKRFDIHHMHLENDAWKLTHAWGKTLCDYNRAGSPLMEIVTEPVFHETEEVMEFLKELQKIMRAAWVSDADMEKWQLRCDVNISLRPKWDTKLYNRVEMKNLNSFSAIWRAIESEAQRQENILISVDGIIAQETRWWDDATGMSTSQRSKEDAMDYRYFPEPDILPIVLDEAFIENCRKQVVELPIEKRLTYLNTYKLSDDDARILTADYKLAAYFDQLVTLTWDPKKSCSYITSILLGLLTDNKQLSIDALQFDITQLARVIELVNNNELSSTNAKQVIEKLFHHWGQADAIIDADNLRQKNDLWFLETIVDEVLSLHQKQVEEYRWGKQNLFAYFVGQCMKTSKWQGNPKTFTDILKKKL